MEVGYNHELPTSAKISNTCRPLKHVMFFPKLVTVFGSMFGLNSNM